MVIIFILVPFIIVLCYMELMYCVSYDLPSRFTLFLLSQFRNNFCGENSSCSPCFKTAPCYQSSQRFEGKNSYS